MRSFEFSLSLRFFSDFVSVKEICSRLGLTPRWVQEKGATRISPSGVLLGGDYERGYCSFDFVRLKDEDLHCMIDRVLKKIDQAKDLFFEVRSTGGRIEFFVGWYSIGNTGDVFDYELMGRLHELGIDLSLDVYGSD